VQETINVQLLDGPAEGSRGSEENVGSGGSFVVLAATHSYRTETGTPVRQQIYH
jgi:hypothetical protein